MSNSGREIVTRVRGMNIDDAIAEALKRDSLLDAQVYMCIWETERIVEQARKNPIWDTCFTRVLREVTKAWSDRAAPETGTAPEAPEKTWDCSICGRSNYVTTNYCEHCAYSRMVLRAGQFVPRNGQR